VHAVIALATRIVNEDNDDAIAAPGGWAGSRVFFEEAEAIIQQSGQSNRLPNIQALGILSLYQLRCGREDEAQELAKVFAIGITELCQYGLLAGKEERYVAVRAATYCGAVSLTRILSLATGQLFGINSVLDESSLFLDDLPPDSGGISPGNYNTRPNLNPNAHARLWDHQLIPQKLFQLTEWVHKLITSAQSDAQTTIHEILPVYNKCLDWYNNFFFFLNADGSRTPFVLFVQ
jgi:hypothetical protein